MKKIYFLFMMAFLFGCNKSKPLACEKWEYYEVCKPKQANYHCQDYGHLTNTVCGDALEDAKAGRETVIMDNAEVKITKHYVKQVQ